LGAGSVAVDARASSVNALGLTNDTGGELRFVGSRDPACVHVDRPGPVREDVPSHGLLGEGLTGENDRLKSGLQRRTPTIPLRGLRSRGGGDRYVNSGNTNRVSVGRVRSALLRRGLRRVAT